MMATKKGSKVNKDTQTVLRLEVQTPKGEWGAIATADKRDDESTEWVVQMAAALKKGRMVYRLTETTRTTRIQTTENVVEGEGAKKRASNGA